ncbi:MAG: GtrA family protein [Gloeomargarita sp. GMQP_bins_120]
MSAKENKILILGAGPAGLTAAYKLSQAGYSVTVLERDGGVGGLAKSIRWRGCIVDLGPHRFFTKIPQVIDLWNEVLGADQVTVKRLTRIFYKQKYFLYPIRIGQVLRTIGIVPSIAIFLSYLKSQILPIRNPKNFSEWVRNQFGDRLFEIFFRGYTEKLWGIKCEEISAEWASQRIKGLSLGKAIRTAFFGNRGRVKSLIDQFQYPRLGSGQLYEKMLAFLQRNNQSVLTNCEVKSIHHDGKRITSVTYKNRVTGEEVTLDCSHTITSIPINIFIESLSPLPPENVLAASRSLRFRNTILVYLLVEGRDLFPDNWLYINDPRVKVGRVTNFANWSPDMVEYSERTPLCCEYWADFGDDLWQADAGSLATLAEVELRSVGLLRDGQSIIDSMVIKLPSTYPVYTGNYKEALSTIRTYVSRFQNLQLVGRYGSFKYNNQDHSIFMGILASENIIYGTQHDLWSVNSDQEYAEESREPVAQSGFSYWGYYGEITKQFIAYLVVGGFATIVDTLVFSLLLLRGANIASALIFSYFCGLTTNFILSRRYVFGIRWRNGLLQYIVFAAVALNSLFANLGIMYTLISEFRWSPIGSRLFSAGCVAVLSFIGHKLYSFRGGNVSDYRAKLDVT